MTWITRISAVLHETPPSIDALGGDHTTVNWFVHLFAQSCQFECSYPALIQLYDFLM